MVTLGDLLAKDAEFMILPSGRYELEVVETRPARGRTLPIFRVSAGEYAGRRVVAGVFECAVGDVLDVEVEQVEHNGAWWNRIVTSTHQSTHQSPDPG